MKKIDAYKAIKILKAMGRKASTEQIAGILRIADCYFGGHVDEAVQTVIVAAYHSNHPQTDSQKLVSQNKNAMRLLNIKYHASEKFHRFESFGKKHRITKNRDAIFNFITIIHSGKLKLSLTDHHYKSIVEDARGDVLMQMAGMGGNDHQLSVSDALHDLFDVVGQRTGITRAIDWILVKIGKILK